MSQDQDIRRSKLIDWKRYAGKTPDEALKQIYEDAQLSSERTRGWYWENIKSKRLASVWSRGLAFLLLMIGTALPLLAGLGDDPKTRLLCTQVAITLLAVAGLIQVADKAFGWSSGWMRYITTATSMESAATTFEIGWTKYFLSKTGALDSNDVQSLFALAEQLERDLSKLQTEETNGWIIEFNAGISLIDSTLKAQREETQKQLEFLRTESVAAQLKAKEQQTAKQDAETVARKAQEPGVVDVVLAFKGEPKPVTIELDGCLVSQEFLGTSWSSGKTQPGLHTILVRAVGDVKLQAGISVSVEAATRTSVEIKVPF